ncbi:MAG: MFS transporter [Jatrophihabitans sp.]|nr:MAG: MFS transporter [Jatrophihabitans sp.]
MQRRGHLRTALAQAGFRHLLATRLTGQFGDGAFQAALAGAVLFNPERQADPATIAAGFAVLLLPYSVLGPFAGVLLDRWWRQRVLVRANLARALVVALVAAEIAHGTAGAVFYLSALAAMSLSRFVNSALSAALPHVVGPDELVTANALSTTAGSVLTATGGACVVAVRLVIGGSDTTDGLLAVVALAAYLGAGTLARWFPRTVLGPDEAERAGRESLAAIARGLVAGARHLRGRPAALYGVAAIGAHRLCFGLWTVTTLLLYRNYFTSDGPLRVGLAGLTQVVGALALGGGIAALVTPPVVRRVGYAVWPATMLLSCAGVMVACNLPYRLGPALAGALALAFASQSLKICVDTLVQVHVADEFRGRVFALYDMLFNLALVVAAVLTAAVLPADGHSPATVIGVAAGYLVVGAAYGRLASRVRSPPSAVPTTA